MRVYAVCRKCAEVHHADVGCPGCSRRALLAPPPIIADGTGNTRRDSTPARSGARAEMTEVSPGNRPRRIWWLSTAVVGAYLLVVLGLLAAALLEI
jgi:hypothetical protein